MNLYVLAVWLRAHLGANLLLVALIATATASLYTSQRLNAATDGDVHDLAHKLGKNMLVLPQGAELERYYLQDYAGISMPDDQPQKIFDSELARHISFAQVNLLHNTTVGDVDLVVAGQRDYRRGQPPHDLVTDGTVLLTASASSRLESSGSGGLSLGDQSLTVAGIASPPPEGADPAVVMGLGTAQHALHREGEMTSMRLAGCWCSVDVPTLGKQVEAKLGGTQAITLAGVLDAQKGTISVVRRYARLVEIGILSLVVLLVLTFVGSRVRARRREMGLLVATGATPRSLAWMFVVEASLIALPAAVLGTLAASPLTELIARRVLQLQPGPMSASMWSTLAMVLAVCLVGAALPAFKAATLEPSELLVEV